MEVMLKEIGEIITGNTPSKNIKEFWDSNDICFIKPDIIADFGLNEIGVSNEYISECARKRARIVSKGSVFVTCIGSIGKIGIAGEGEYAFNQQINAIVPNSKINPRYLAYNLLFNKQRLIAVSNAPVVPIINKSQFGEFVVNIEPDINKQYRIVDILDKLSLIINNRKEELNQLDNIIRARFVELFGDPLNNTKGWGEQRLGECCVINPKKNIDSRLEEDLVISFIPMASVSENGEILKLENRFYKDVKNGFTYFCEGDVLFAKITPCMENGKGAVAVGLTNSIGFGSTEFHILRPIKEKSNSYWLYVLTSFDFFRKKAEENMTGSAGQKRVQASFLENIKISVPPITLQEEFEQFVHQVNKSKFDYLLIISNPYIQNPNFAVK